MKFIFLIQVNATVAQAAILLFITIFPFQSSYRLHLTPSYPSSNKLPSILGNIPPYHINNLILSPSLPLLPHLGRQKFRFPIIY